MYNVVWNIAYTFMYAVQPAYVANTQQNFHSIYSTYSMKAVLSGMWNVIMYAGGIACCVCCHRIFLAVYMLLQLFAIFSQFISTPDSVRILASLVWKLPTLFLCTFCEKGWVLNLCLYTQSELIIFIEVSIYDGKTNLNTHTHFHAHERDFSQQEISIMNFIL